MAHIPRIYRNPLPLAGLVLAVIVAGCATPPPPAAPSPTAVPAPTPVPAAPPLIVIAPTAPSLKPAQAPSPEPAQAPAPLPPVASAPSAPVVPAERPPVIAAAPKPAGSATQSRAATARDYRRDAASHLYGQNAHRIYAGKMPAMLDAIGVLQVEVDGRGQVTRLNWMRSPTHAPEVVAEIERTVRRAAPFPLPVRLGQVTYTDTWLWHKSGRFQLDTLTEGQL